METVELSKIAAKRNRAIGEYRVTFANGEALFLPPRRVCQKPKFKDGKFVDVDSEDIMSDELREMCNELVLETDGPEITGRPLELLFGVASLLISTTYDVNDEDLAELLTLSYGTSEHESLRDQWPTMIYLWVLGGEEMTGILDGRGKTKS